MSLAATDAKGIYLLCDPREAQSLKKVLHATGSTVHFADPRADDAAATARRSRLAIVDYDSIQMDAKELLTELGKRPNPPAVLVLTATRNKEDLVELLSHDIITNFLAKNVALEASDLLVTVQKIMNNDIFGLDKYLSWGLEPHVRRLAASEEKSPTIDELEAYLQGIGVNGRLIGLAKGVADEFIMNAIYNAPVDAAGVPKYTSMLRSEPVHLDDSEQVEFSYACDGRVLALSVVDRFGRLETGTVRSYLRKCFAKGEDQIDQKDGGAGLGLYYIFTSLNQLVINVAPGERTEMIGLMDISGSFRDFAHQPKSLNLFVKEENT